MRQSTRQYKADLEELADSYQQARDDEFNQQLIDFLPMDKNTVVSEDDITGFIDSFTFDSEEEWCINEYESRRDSYHDQKYQEFKDRDM